MPPPRRVLAALALLVAACGGGGATAPDAGAPTPAYDEAGAAERFPHVWSDPADAYYARLRPEQGLDAVVAGAATDLARVQAVSRWAHTRFGHDGASAAPRPDPASILRDAAGGRRFRCVEYATVVSGALTALGIRARMVWLLTRDEGTRTDGVAHVVAEAWLRDAGRWVMVDAQWDAVPLLDGRPIDAVALQGALARGTPGLAVASRSGTRTADYARWVAPYLHYFYTPLDHRVELPRGAAALVLAPVGDESLARKYAPPAVLYTRSTQAFYAPPE
ncbi:transglutaminase-like domain-containing protein [Roseisolibacter sp. H3M3-2]|uniref:transglutaminase-like domain-containing protein n=1 Tax=Roseisolibacter sp. H3M3-2 TaxID=3031323 RepID=UPI0023DCCF4F|nr:transglutaminase-like domain-containing protein [Roseisolibacter sp. H3M3-2]MDF1504153.1 transglutaminase-like domain-containing protein [Roseisolibacter sp. H3M3-2]